MLLYRKHGLVDSLYNCHVILVHLCTLCMRTVFLRTYVRPTYLDTVSSCRGIFCLNFTQHYLWSHHTK